jgi:transcriptional regulator with XRE-family HTH domain
MENTVNQEIATRLKSGREEAGLSVADCAAKLSVSPAQLTAYESGETDIPVALLHNAAPVLGVTTTELMTGEPAKLRKYALVRAGKGVAVQRRKEYGYRSLAYNFEGRRMEPMYITVPAGDPQPAAEMPSHSGEEFHYCLEGSFRLEIGEHSVTVNAGDSIYFDATCPHRLTALGGESAKTLAIITM